jgi:hypothetical protein
MHSGPEAFRPIDGPSGNVLRPQREALHAYAYGVAGSLWRLDVCEVGPNSMHMATIATAHSAVSWHSANIGAHTLIASYDAGLDVRKRARASVFCCACRLALAWLVTLQLSRALELKSGEGQTGPRHRLSLTTLPLNDPVVQCSCRAALCHTNFDV